MYHSPTLLDKVLMHNVLKADGCSQAPTSRVEHAHLVKLRGKETESKELYDDLKTARIMNFSGMMILLLSY